MTFAAFEGTVGTDPTPIELPGPDGYRMGINFMMTNTSDKVIWCGGEDVNIGKRWPWPIGGIFPLELNKPDTLYGYVVSGQGTYAWLKQDD
jgi:hypothetical protein